MKRLEGSGSDLIAESDVRGIVRLLGEVIANRGDFPESRRMLMDGLCRMVHATSWAWCMADYDPEHSPSFVGFEHGGWDEERFARYIEAMNHPGHGAVTYRSSIELKEKGVHLTRTQQQIDPENMIGSSPFGELWARADIGTVILSQRPMESGGVSGVAVYRKTGEAHFSERESRIVHIILSEVPWLHFSKFPDRHSGEISRLYPRHRMVLNFLCEGWNRKKIAHFLGISENTVHGYVKEVFRHFRVHSQSELLAKFTKGDGGDQ